MTLGGEIDPPVSNAGRLRLLATDTVVYGFASAINKGFSLVLFPLLTRALSVDDYGRLDLALYASTLFGLVMIWGQDSAVARLFFEDRDTSYRRQIISQALMVMVGNMALAAAAFFALERSGVINQTFGADTQRIALLLLIYAPVSGLVSFCQGLLKWTFQRTRYIIIALGVPAANLILLLILAHRESFGLVTALSVMVVVSATFATVGMAFIRGWLARPRMDFVAKLLPLALPYGAIASISAVSPLFERAVISGRFSASDLGLYAAAAKIASVATMLSIAFQMGWGPFSYSLYKEPGAARTYSLVLRSFAALMCVVVLAISALAEPLASFVAGERYQGASVYVFPLAMALAIQAIGWITEIGLHLSKRIYLNLVGFTLFLIISLTGIMVLSRLIGIIGVPIAALVGQIAMLLTSAVLAQKAFPIAWDYRLPAATVGITLASGFAAVLVRFEHPDLPTWWIYAAGMAAIGVLNVTVGIAPSDWQRIRALGARLSPRLR